MQGQLTGLTKNMDGTYNITITVREDVRSSYEKLKAKPIDVEIRVHRNKRSNDANAFCWALCGDIGRAIGSTALDVYKKSVHDVGVYEPMPIRADHLETFIRRWSEKGSAWFVDVIDDSKLEGYKRIHAYYGSSVYDTAEMSRLIDSLVDEALMVGVKIPASKAQIDEYKRSWRPRVEEPKGDKHG